MRAIRRRHLWIVVLAVGAGLCIAFRATGDRVPQATIVLGVGMLATAGVVVGRGGWSVRRTPWVLALSCLAAWAFVGNVFWQAGILLDGTPPAPFSVADAGFLIGDILWLAFLVVLLHQRSAARGSLIDAAITSVTAAALSWLFIFDGFVLSDAFPVAVRATQLAYAVVDVLLAGVLALLLVTRGPRTTSFWLVVTATASLLLGDVAWNWLIVAGEYRFGSYTDLGWLAFAVLALAAAVHPTAGALVAREAPGVPSLTRGSVALLFGASLTAPVALMAHLVVTGHDDWVEDSVALVCIAAVSTLVIARMVGSLREQAVLSSRLEAQNSQLLELDRMKDAFVSSVSHELRTPLTSIRGYVDLIADGDAGPLTSEQESFLGIVDRNADRLLRLVGDLLLVAQIDAGKLHLASIPLDLNEVIEACLTAARPRAEAREIAIEFERVSLPTLIGDPERLEQVFDNLISNAVKFAPPRGRVRVSAWPTQTDVVVEVSDDGPGIPPSDQARLFERFFRSSHSIEHAIAGTGLGLSIVQSIVDAHGATISYANAPGGGATFTVALPQATVPATPSQHVLAA